VAYEYGGQMGLFASGCYNLLYLFSNLGLDSRCCCFTVN
jgi:hypothetical protein